MQLMHLDNSPVLDLGGGTPFKTCTFLTADIFPDADFYDVFH